MLSTNTAVKAQEAKRQELAADVERFLNSGGEIIWCDSSWNADTESDPQRLRRRSFELRVTRESFGKRDGHRLVRK